MMLAKVGLSGPDGRRFDGSGPGSRSAAALPYGVRFGPTWKALVPRNVHLPGAGPVLP